MVPENSFFIDVECRQNNHAGELICGDVFLSHRIKEEGRIIAVLSDGMGSGVKANVLATLTSSMAMNFTIEHREVARTAEIIMNTLPVCSVRKVSYSTFTIIDIEHDGVTTIVEYDNPLCLITRGQEEFDPGWEDLVLKSEQNKGKKLRICKFKAQLEDRIFFWSDGIVQSGMGTRAFPFGWGRDELGEYVKKIVRYSPYASSGKLAQKVINMALLHDEDKPKDDSSCGVIYYREPRKLLLITGPPFDEHSDFNFALKLQQFKGKKIIAGGTTAEIIARELVLTFDAGIESEDNELPPASHMEGVDLVTEGILTLGKVARLLETYNSNVKLSNGPADQIIKMLLESDQIHILNGTRINVAHQDPDLPVELEIRRTVVKRIIRLLEEKLLKNVDIEYL